MNTLNRRNFLKFGSAGIATTLLPFPVMAQQLKNPQKTLVVVEFNGGNDGLNTVIPYTEADYYTARPTIHIPKKEQLPVTDSLAFHPAFKPLLPLLEDGEMCTVLGLGYPGANRSHFRSIEIWDTASNSDEYLTNGWLAKPQAETYLADAIVIGRNSAPVSSEQTRTIVIDSIENFYKQSRRIDLVDGKATSNALGHLMKTQNDTKEAALSLKAKAENNSLELPEFGGGEFGRQLREIARLILMGNTAPVMKVALGGFDTHQNQKATQAALLAQLAQGIKSFQQVLKTTGHWEDVLVMTYSEFGRRVAENGSGGTDHGTAAPHFVMGGSVKGGFYGEQPDLEDLNRGDMKFTTNFKQYYQTITADFLNTESAFADDSLGFIDV